MGQRHNRRRTRPRSRSHNNLSQATPISTVDQASRSPLATLSSSVWSSQTSYTPPLASTVPSSAACIPPGSPVPTFPAPTWHYGYMSSQIRESSSQLEAGRFETQRCRLFGGEPGDDISLCYRMLEYFGGLDYIDSAQDRSLCD